MHEQRERQADQRPAATTVDAGVDRRSARASSRSAGRRPSWRSCPRPAKPDSHGMPRSRRCRLVHAEVDERRGRREQQHGERRHEQRAARSGAPAPRACAPADAWPSGVRMRALQPFRICWMRACASSSASFGFFWPTSAAWIAVAIVSPMAGHCGTRGRQSTSVSCSSDSQRGRDEVVAGALHRRGELGRAATATCG